MLLLRDATGSTKYKGPWHKGDVAWDRYTLS